MLKLKLYFDLLNYLLSYKQKSIDDLLKLIDKFFRGLSIPFILCLQRGKGLDKLKHPNILFFDPETNLDDDQIILRLAKENEGYVVSNDTFRQYTKYNKYVSSRRIGHNIKDDNLKLFIPESNHEEVSSTNLMNPHVEGFV